MNISQACPAQTDCRRYIGQSGIHQDNIRRINRNIRSCTNRNANFCSGQSRCIINPVTDHGNPASGLQLPDDLLLSVRKYTCNDPVYASLMANRPGCSFIISRQHNNLNTHILKFFYCLGRIFLDHICDCDQTCKLSIFFKVKRCFSFCSKRICRGRKHCRNLNPLSNKASGAAIELFSLYYALQAVSGKCLEFTYFLSYKAKLLPLFHDSSCQRMFTFLFQGKGKL